MSGLLHPELPLRRMRLRGLETAWLQSESQDRPILMMFHGFPDSPTTWREQIREFGKDFEIVAPFARGTSPSLYSRETRRYGMKSHLVDHLQILRQVDPAQQRRVYCLGHDLGAVHAWNVARHIPHRLGGLAIINGVSLEQMAHRLLTPRQALKSWYIGAFQVPQLPEFLVARWAGSLLRFARRLGAHAPEAIESEGYARQVMLHSLNQYRAMLREAPEAAWSTRKLPRIDAPVLLLWGHEDRFLIPPHHDEISPYARRFQIRILRGNHWLHRDQAAEVNRHLRNFLSEGQTP